MRESANKETFEAGKAAAEAVIMEGKDEWMKELATEILRLKQLAEN